tara:strand:+ start:568 stop:696 length:129 start_codon:yes stop_codon:yes gene_type:complete
VKKRKLSKEEEIAIHNRLYFEQLNNKFFKLFKGSSNNEKEEL